MKTSEHMQTRICGCCKRKLPLQEFRIVRKNKGYDSWCKKCRSTIGNANQALKLEKERDYLVITEIEDPQQRMETARAAHLKAKEIAIRTYRNRINEEGERELRYKKGGWNGTY